MSDSTPQAFHVMAKPTGARCNLRCDYCFFLEKEDLYPGSGFRMSDEVMEAYVSQTVRSQRVPQVSMAWQGGEPTLMGLDFFRRARAAEDTCVPPGMAVERTIQTNGVLLDDEWADFLAQNGYLVGLSIDGPRDLHDAFRHDKAGNSVFDRVLSAARRLQEHGVDLNVLCTINAANSSHPLEVYRFFRDELQTPYVQFIPIVEIDTPPTETRPGTVTERSVRPEAYGRFMSEIFDEWIRRDVGEMFVQFFDGVLAAYLFGQSSLCVLQPTCGEGVVLEHTGDLYSCDHFVDAEHLLGNIMESDIGTLVRSEKQRAFGMAKRETLPAYCLECEYLFACHGECPKNRILMTPEGEPGLNWLCEGLKDFFAHTERPMRMMAEILRRGGEAPDIMAIFAS
ncbi:MAG: anaerobic sulfatase maturase [Coriobacteriia bacterium]|nr:anaerobic sulfatase maturase [Coriobacteriia bacterium]